MGATGRAASGRRLSVVSLGRTGELAGSLEANVLPIRASISASVKRSKGRALAGVVGTDALGRSGARRAGISL